jgi:hypothetical protein
MIRFFVESADCGIVENINRYFCSKINEYQSFGSNLKLNNMTMLVERLKRVNKHFQIQFWTKWSNICSANNDTVTGISNWVFLNKLLIRFELMSQNIDYTVLQIVSNILIT